MRKLRHKHVVAFIGVSADDQPRSSGGGAGCSATGAGCSVTGAAQDNNTSGPLQPPELGVGAPQPAADDQPPGCSSVGPPPGNSSAELPAVAPSPSPPGAADDWQAGCSIICAAAPTQAAPAAPPPPPPPSRHVSFFVEEYLDGGSLKAAVLGQMVHTGKRTYRYEDALRWSAGVAQGLRYLHEGRPMVIHRDLKLDNILLQVGRGVGGGGGGPEGVTTLHISHSFPAISHQPPATSHQSLAIGHQPPATSHQPPATSHRSSVISHQPSAISHQPPVISHQPSVISHQSSPHQPSAIGHQPSPHHSSFTKC